MGGQSVSRLTQWLAIVAIALDRKLGDLSHSFFTSLEQHLISSAALIQSGKAGVDIQTLYGEPNAQDSTGMANLNANLSGYLP